MSNRRKPSADFIKRTTAVAEGVTITPPDGTPPETKRDRKHYVGIDHAPTEEEALAMGRALFDAIASERTKDARQETS
jgi:hypothetical protein